MGAHATGMTELIDDFQRAHDEVIEGAKKVVGQGCNNIKKDAQRIIRASSRRGYLPHYPRSIGYDVTASGALVSGEIGPAKGRLQGGLGPYIENGTIHNAPIPHLSPALDTERPAFERYAQELGASLLEGGLTPSGPVMDSGT